MEFIEIETKDFQAKYICQRFEADFSLNMYTCFNNYNSVKVVSF